MTPDQFRTAMSRLPTAVTVVTASGPGGPAGATANAVASLSLDPPLMLACLDRGSRTLTALRETGHFAVNVLAAGQDAIARGFSTKASHAEKWREIAYVEHEGVPVLEGAVAWVVCRVRELHDGGDHEIAVGEALALGADGGEPLVFHQGTYLSLRAAQLPGE